MLVRDYRFPAVHISQFHPRPGTPAARMPRVPTKAVKERSRALTALHEQFDPLSALVGRTVRAWFVDVAADGRKLVGHTKNYSQVLVEPVEGLLGSSAMVKVVSAGRWSVLGEVVSVVTTPYADAVAAGRAGGAGAGGLVSAARSAGKGRSRGAALAAAAAEMGAEEDEGQGETDGGACGGGDCERSGTGGASCGSGACDCEGTPGGAPHHHRSAAEPGHSPSAAAARAEPRHVSFEAALGGDADRGRSTSRKAGGSTNSAAARAERESPEGASASAGAGVGACGQEAESRVTAAWDRENDGGSVVASPGTSKQRGGRGDAEAGPFPEAARSPARAQRPGAAAAAEGSLLTWRDAALGWAAAALLALLLRWNAALLVEVLEEQQPAGAAGQGVAAAVRAILMLPAAGGGG